MWLLFLACAFLTIGQSLGEGVFTDLDISDPTWKAQFTENYKKGHINVSPENIEILRAIHNHIHYWLLGGGREVLIYTIRVNGGNPCNVTSQYAFLTSTTSQPPQVNPIQAILPFGQDHCGIVVSHDVPAPERRDSIHIGERDVLHLDDPSNRLNGFAESNEAFEPAGFENI